MGKLKWVTKSVSFSCQDPPKCTKSLSFPSAFRVYPFSPTRFGAAEDMIKHCSTRLLDLVTDIMDISAMRSKTMKLNKTSCNLAQMIEETAQKNNEQLKQEV